MIYIIGIYITFTFFYSIIKKNNTLNSFTKGVKDGINIVLSMFQILLTFTFCINAIEKCGIIDDLMKTFNNSAIITIIIQMIIRPLSNGSSYALLLNIYDKYGINSIYGYLSTFVHSSCDTLFYIISIYSSYAKIKLGNKPLLYGLLTIIFSYIIIFIICFIFLKK